MLYLITFVLICIHLRNRNLNAAMNVVWTNFFCRGAFKPNAKQICRASRLDYKVDAKIEIVRLNSPKDFVPQTAQRWVYRI